MPENELREGHGRVSLDFLGVCALLLQTNLQGSVSDHDQWALLRSIWEENTESRPAVDGRLILLLRT